MWLPRIGTFLLQIPTAREVWHRIQTSQPAREPNRVQLIVDETCARLSAIPHGQLHLGKMAGSTSLADMEGGGSMLWRIKQIGRGDVGWWKWSLNHRCQVTPGLGVLAAGDEAEPARLLRKGWCDDISTLRR